MTQTFIGKVTSNKMMKSVVVTVTYLRKLPKYHVWRRFQSKIMAHDALDECEIGDTVRIHSCRPLSKRKAFKVTELLSRARQYDNEAKETGRKQSAVQQLQAEERRMALENELMSRRQFMDQQAIEQAEKEIEEYQPTIERIEAAKKAMKEQFYKEPAFPFKQSTPTTQTVLEDEVQTESTVGVETSPAEDSQKQDITESEKLTESSKGDETEN